MKVEINQLCVGERDTIRNAYAFDKIYGNELPRPFLKSCGSGIANNCLEFRTKKSTFLSDEMPLYTLFAKSKENLYSVVTQYIVKVYRKSQTVLFLKVNHFSISQNFLNVKA